MGPAGASDKAGTALHDVPISLFQVLLLCFHVFYILLPLEIVEVPRIPIWIRIEVVYLRCAKVRDTEDKPNKNLQSPRKNLSSESPLLPNDTANLMPGSLTWIKLWSSEDLLF